MARLEWRPSRLLAAALCTLAIAAAFAVLASEMPRIAAWSLALGALAYGIWQARLESRRLRRELVIVPGDGSSPSLVDGVPVEALTVRWRGPLAFVCWRDDSGCTQRLAFWPDTLHETQRRELRLAAPKPDAAHPHASMAP